MYRKVFDSYVSLIKHGVLINVNRLLCLLIITTKKKDEQICCEFDHFLKTTILKSMTDNFELLLILKAQ